MEKFGHCFMTIYLEVSSTQRTWKLAPTQEAEEEEES